jgi:hypothetical protein
MPRRRICSPRFPREVDKDLWLLEAHLDAGEIGQRIVGDAVSSGAREASLA